MKSLPHGKYRRHVRTCLFKFLAFLGLCFIAACSPDDESPALRLASNYWIGYEPFYVAESMQLFDEGSVHLIEAPFSFMLEQSLRGGTVDAASVSLSKAFSLVEEGFDITIVLVLDWSNGADKLLAQPEIKTVADLKGHRVASEPNTVNNYLLVRALQKNDMSLTDITLVPHVNEAIVTAYEAGDVIAGSVFGAEVSRLKNAGAHIIFDSSLIPGEILDVLIVRTPYLKKYPERVEQMIAGWLKGVNLIKGLPEGETKPLGVLSDIDYSEASNEIRYAASEENIAFMRADAAQLRAVIQSRLAINGTFGDVLKSSRPPPIDTSPFYAVHELGGE